MSKIKIYNQDYAIGKPFLSVQTHRNQMTQEILYKTGQYHSAFGTVVLHMQGFGCSKQEQCLIMDYYSGGRGYYRTIQGKIYTNIGMARKAGEFIRDVHNI